MTHANKEKKIKIDFYLEKLKLAGLKLTPVRKLLIKSLTGTHKLMTIDDLLLAINKLDQKANDWTTVYRCLKKFEEAGVVHSTSFDGSLTYYELTDPHHHHHHIICKTCQKVTPIHACSLEKIEKDLKKLGFIGIQHKLEFFGTCLSCQ